VLPYKGLVIVDEAHNLVNAIKLAKNWETIEYTIHKFARGITLNSHIQVLLMTATPVINENRIGDLFKLLNMVKKVGSPDRLEEGP
jgi:SNF2 family DNA or RNA helicase